MIGMRALAALVLMTAAGCGDDDGTPRDAGSRDGAGRDAGPEPTDAGRPPPMCGNGIPEMGESCDDGNDVAGDGCTADCMLEPGCGDGVVEAPEVCDDGNRGSGDGCGAGCDSDESCGNGVLDLAAGEICDDANTSDGDGCSMACAVEACGDSMTDVGAGETCDDGNTMRWDGCGPDCVDELTLVTDVVQTTDASMGCDLNADGAVDNAFATGLAGLFPLFNALLTDSISTATLLLVLPMVGLDSPSDDPEIFTGLVHGADADADPMNNFTGMADLVVLRVSLGADGFIPTPMRGAVTSSMLSAGPENIRFFYQVDPMFPDFIVMANAMLQARVESSGGALSRLSDGRLCGALTMRGLADAGNPLAGVTGFARVDGCDGTMTTSFADVITGGASALGFASVPIQPDVDLDRDGLERFEVLRDGPPGCQATISACIDGDGTRIDGADCVRDPRIADGISASFDFSAVPANIVGTR